MIREDLQDETMQTADEQVRHDEILMRTDSEEIAALQNAFKGVEDKIAWHKLQIEAKQAEVENHSAQIAELQRTLQSKFGSLVGQIGGINAAPVSKLRGRPPGSKNNVKAKTSGQNGKVSRQVIDQNAGRTSELIVSCLKKFKKPVDAHQIIKFLQEQGNSTNPSVELSRMVSKGLILRPSRGHYMWKAESEQ